MDLTDARSIFTHDLLCGVEANLFLQSRIVYFLQSELDGECLVLITLKLFHEVCSRNHTTVRSSKYGPCAQITKLGLELTCG